MSYGLNSSQDIFQKRMDQTFERWKGANPIADDILVLGTDDNHNTHLHKAMERVRSAGIKLDFEKCMIKSKCTFFGDVYTPQGVKPDLKKVKAIKKRIAPQTKQELQSFLGMVNYLAQCIKNMAELRENLRLLIRKDVLFQWTESHEDNFQKLKDCISSDAYLMFYNSSKSVILQVDTSKLGLGACLLQENNHGKLRPVAHTPKSLTPAERRYANIEREMLAVLCGCIKFHYYLYGRKYVYQ